MGTGRTKSTSLVKRSYKVGREERRTTPNSLINGWQNADLSIKHESKGGSCFRKPWKSLKMPELVGAESSKCLGS